MGPGKRTTLTALGGGVERRGGTVRGRAGWGGITPGEMPDVGDGQGMETANHHGMYVPMQQSCRIQDVHMYPRAQSTTTTTKKKAKKQQRHILHDSRQESVCRTALIKPSDLVRLIYYHESSMEKTCPHESVTSH